jgi:hypothetical protein
MRAALIAFLKARNNHQNLWVAWILGSASLLLIGGHGMLEAAADAYLGPFAGMAYALIEGAYQVAFYVAWPALIAAGLGRTPVYANPPKD